MTTAHPDPRVGTDLGPYRIERVLGRGGMGVVYLAEQASLGRKVALKVLAPDLVDEEAFRQRFVRESQMAAAIDHPNILPIYEAGEADGVYFLAMRYVEGVDLDSRLRAGALEPREAISLLAQVASALDAAAEAGLVHRDVKPANILVASGKGMERADHAYLTDFGLTKHRGSQSGLTQSGAFMGTLDYIAPEQVEGRDVDGRTDQYSLACVAFHALTGRTPFPRDTDIAIAMAHLHDSPPSALALHPELPADADAVLARGMAKKPDDRYPTSEAFTGALRQALGVRATQPHPAPATVGRPGRGRAALAGAMVVVAALAVVAVVASQLGIRPPGASPGTSVADSGSGDFPTTAESALLATLPDDLLRATCVRGSYAAQPNFEQPNSSAAGTPDALASVVCTPSDPASAEALYLQTYPTAGAGATFLRERLDEVASQLDIALGDCATEDQALGRWEHGDLLCFRSVPFGRSWLYWTDASAGLLAAASREDTAGVALYDWWLANAASMHELAGASPRPGAAPSPTRTAATDTFPNTTEIRLIAAIPPEQGAECDRGDGRTLPTSTDIAGPPGPELKPRGHVVCRLSGGVGPDRLDSFNVLTGDLFRAWDVIQGLGHQVAASEGVCGPIGSTVSEWPSADALRGMVLCSTDAGADTAVITWSDGEWVVFRVEAPASDRGDLIDWWLANAPAMAEQ